MKGIRGFPTKFDNGLDTLWEIIISLGRKKVVEMFSLRTSKFIDKYVEFSSSIRNITT